MPKKQRIEDFIDAVWISETESGIVIFEEIYKDITKYGISTDMILSFLSALVNFADEVFVGEIKHIKLSNHKIFFYFLKQIMLVISISDKIDMDETKVNVLIERIGKKFNLKFENLYNQELWYVNIDLFNSFSKDLRGIINKEPKSIKIVHSISFSEKIKKLNKAIDDETNKYLNRKQKLEKVYEQSIKRLESKKKKSISKE
ncbi:MAG: hypothetical protein EU529_04455 [Promethearchaeota archaeon]|nr:MAG: hypothetical protein EU529_04455 [Candidatus Lokiarchaeota archaeon]